MNFLVRGVEAPAEAIHPGVLRTAARHPGRTAVRCGPRRITYRELAADAHRVARSLRRRGVRPGELVPVVARRGVDLPALLLGVLMAGAGYALLDVRWPTARVADLVAAMRPCVVVADPSGAKPLVEEGIEYVLLADLLADDSADAAGDELPEVAPAAVATLFWTSGSTGRPKGVPSTHQATTRLFGADPCVPFGPEPVMANAAAVPWDAFSLELWAMLLRGGTVLVHEDDLLLPANLRGYIRDDGMTHLFLTPALFDVLVQADLDCLSGIRVLTLGGDRPSVDSCAKFLAAFPDAELYNGYGPVESCVFASTWRITLADLEAGRPIPVGRPVAGTGLCVVRDGTVLPRGELGEIALSGSGLARGYLDDPRRTNESFRSVRADGQDVRVYLTGDQGRLDEDGVLHFAGRADNQFKIAGHRIEAGEVEAGARAAGCAQAAAMSLRASGEPRLVLFAVPAEDGLTEAGLRAALAERLPAYLVPARVHLLPGFLLMENTKIDRRRLAADHGYQSP